MKNLLKPTVVATALLIAGFSAFNINTAVAGCSDIYEREGAKNRLFGGCKIKPGFVCVIIKCEKQIDISL